MRRHERAGKPVASEDMDNLVSVAYVPSNTHARNVLHGITADFSAAVSAIKSITIKTGPTTADGSLNASTLSRGSTDTAVASTLFQYVISRVTYSKAAVAAGTALAAGTIPSNKWGIYLFSVDSSGTITSTAGAANFTTGYDNEAAAIAALPSTPADEASMGYVTVLTAVGLAFVGGTDALQGGVSGNPSSDTNYYSTPITLTTVGSAFRWDFTNGMFVLELPIPYSTEINQALAIELAASGSGGTTGTVTAWVETP